MERSFLILLMLFALPGCEATMAMHRAMMGETQSRELESIPAGKYYPGPYVDIRAPDSDGWKLIHSSTEAMMFGRWGESSNETFAAQMLIIWGINSNETPDEFISSTKLAFTKDLDLDRFTITKSDYEYTDQRGYPCVRCKSVAEDKDAQTSAGREALILQTDALYCKHPYPDRQEMGFTAIYSHRGSSLYSDFDIEAQDFIDGIQVPST